MCPIYLSLFYWEDHPVSSQISKRAIGGVPSLVFATHTERFTLLSPSPLQACSLELQATFTGSLQPVGVSAGTSPAPVNQELQEWLQIKDGRNAASKQKTALSPTSQTIIQNVLFSKKVTPSYTAP